jgi:regulator of sigma E protease
VFSDSLFIVEAIVAFGFLVFVHELGHFLAAKWIKVKVETFSLGFGPALKKFKWGETEYRLSAVPLGGYVKMAGEEPNPEKTPEPGDFYSKSPGQRALVFVAGVTMNLIFGILIFIAAYRIGVPVVPAVVGELQPGSPAWKADLQRGDRITAIKGVSPPIDFEDVMTTMMLSSGKPIQLTIQRGKEEFKVDLRPEYDPDLGMQMVGITAPVEMVVTDLPKDESADFRRALRAGLKPGDRVFAVEVWGKKRPVPVETINDYLEAIAWSGGRPLTIFAMRNGKVEKIRVAPDMDEKAQRWIGVSPGSRAIEAVRDWAKEAGLAPGDEVVDVAGTPTRSATDVTDALKQVAGETAPIKVLRDGREIDVTADVAARDPGSDLVFSPSTVVDRCFPDCPAAKAGIQPGDQIVSIDGSPVTDWSDVHKGIGEAKDRPLKIAWRHDGELMTATLMPQEPWTLPVAFTTPRETIRAGLFQSVRLGGRKAFQWVARVYASIRQLVLGKVSVKLLSGPVSIARLTYIAAKHGAGTLFYIVAVLSINLAVMNLLPIPVLDGGHLLFAGIEKVRGKPVHEKVRAAATYVGLSLLLALVAVAFWNDITNWIFG